MASLIITVLNLRKREGRVDLTLLPRRDTINLSPSTTDQSKLKATFEAAVMRQPLRILFLELEQATKNKREESRLEQMDKFSKFLQPPITEDNFPRRELAT